MMKTNIKYQIEEKPSFEKKVEYLEQTIIPDIDKESMCIVDNVQSGYEDPRWVERSNSIKARDNYTCQLCHAFNPGLGEFVFIKQGDYDTVHHYFWAGSSKYKIHVKSFILTITFDFYPGFHLTMPRLNVHHKIYYRNKDLLDYEDECLVTLCEDCHHYVHSLKDNGVPIVEKNTHGQTVLLGQTRPKTYQPKLDHTDLGTFRPLSIVKEKKGEYEISRENLAEFNKAKNDGKQWFDYQKILDDTVVNISYFSGKHPLINHTREETKHVAEFIIQDFIENILGFSKSTQKK